MVNTMRKILHESLINIPANVKIMNKSRLVTVTGPRGTLRRSFRHLAVDLSVVNEGKQLKAELWWGTRKAIACIRTVTTHIKNMVTGVTKGFLYKMRLVYAHFPISVGIEGAGKEVQIRNFLGEKIVRSVKMFDGVTAARSTDGTKDEITLQGNSIEAVSQSAANIHTCARVKDKDIRKFLDGAYVSHRGLVVKDD